MARFALPTGVGIDFNSTKPTKTQGNPEKNINHGTSAAYGIVFGLLCSFIAWMLLAYGIYRIHALFIPIR